MLTASRNGAALSSERGTTPICHCKNYTDDGSRIHTGTKSATLLEALSRNEPDDVVLNLLEVDTEGMAQKGSICTQYAYYVEEKRLTGCQEFHCEYYATKEWKPSDGYDGLDCVYTSGSWWSTYPLQFALMKERSFAVVNAMLVKHKQAIYRGQKTLPSEHDSYFYWLPLHYAASRGKSPETTELLIRAYPQGLDVEDLQYKRGRTPREIARMAGDALDSESLELLMRPTSYWTESEGNNIPDAFPDLPSTNQSSSGEPAYPPDPFAQMPLSSNQIVYESSDSGGSTTLLSSGVVLLFLALVAVFGAWLVRHRR
eukprot:CAMPEP_0197437938 /NCGR_PEP_ID=MMETSP1175-20131217/5068_1 /TAXON_ID=1003142 /ORGANISM="Triceratium dubium, Strain CCMP147" /LENGTH=313 /DNA_ID=CAMNT_0042967577 /DNA_START=95 /DNA_END=1032 /DNA_ORIENTATION=+